VSFRDRSENFITEFGKEGFMKRFFVPVFAMILLTTGFTNNARKPPVTVMQSSSLKIATLSQNNSPEPWRRRMCTPGIMKGTHGYSYNGTVNGSPIAAVGPITFDGDGNLSATYTVSLGGKKFEGAFTGTYEVNLDCTGTVTLHLPVLGVTSNGSFIIVNDGRETFFTGTDAGVTVTGVTKRL
jgi:hypothetical protein